MNRPGKSKQTGFWETMRLSFLEMKRNDPMRMAGATAFFTTFAIPPILIILFQLFTLFLSKKMVSSEMVEILTNTFGKESSNQIRVTTRGFRKIAQNWFYAAAGFLFLVFVATTVFTVIKNTLNDIWQVKIKDKQSPLFYLKRRGRSLFVILVAGILFLASVILDAFEVLAAKYMTQIFSGGGRFFTGAMNEITGAIVVTLWFIMIFRYLADGRPSWKVALVGGCLTGLLFSIGKTILSFLMRHSNVGTIYGASGSLVLLLLFVFYSSFILYYGASFIKVYAGLLKQPIKPLDHAYNYQLQVIG
jgi:membrane protein